MVRWQRIYGIAIINYILGHKAVIVDEYYALPTTPYARRLLNLVDYERTIGPVMLSEETRTTHSVGEHLAVALGLNSPSSCLLPQGRREKRL